MSNTRKLQATAACAFVICSSLFGAAHAADTQTVPVTATVKQVCKFSGTASTIAFGVIDPNTKTGEAEANVTLPFKCTTGFQAAITVGVITPLKSGTTNEMAFTVDAFTVPVGSGFSTPVNATSKAKIAESVYKAAAAGDYTGSVVLSINGGD